MGTRTGGSASTRCATSSTCSTRAPLTGARPPISTGRSRSPLTGSPTTRALDAPSDMSWNDHSAALRAVVLACLADQLPTARLARRRAPAPRRDARATPRSTWTHGNHALNQSIGLLEVGRVTGNAGWVALAADRIAVLIQASIDDQGVTNEGSIGYQLYNYRRYSVARERLVAVGIEPPAAFQRVKRMPSVPRLRHAAHRQLRADRRHDRRARRRRSRTPGRSTPRPAVARAPSRRRRTRLFDAGYLFGRSGWGEQRAFRRETAFSVRCGPAAFIHGHRRRRQPHARGVGLPPAAGLGAVRVQRRPVPRRTCAAARRTTS